MTIRQMGVGRGVSVGDGEGGRGDIGVFLSLVWTPPDPDTLCGPLVDSHGFRYEGRMRGEGEGHVVATTGGGGEHHQCGDPGVLLTLGEGEGKRGSLCVILM